MSRSRKTKGAFRGFYHNKGKIAGHAELIKVKQNSAVVLNTVNATIGIASMIVGQYYMTQIDKQLTSLQNSLSQISGFQDNQYKSKVLALMTKIQSISSFRVEILENDQLRNATLLALDNSEQQCIELLGQANLTIIDHSNKENIDFNDYEKELYILNNWCSYQKILLDTLYRIADLKFALYLGSISREQCNALLSVYNNQCQEVCAKLTLWHKNTVKRLDIDMSDMRRRRNGLDGVIHSVAGLFDDNYNFTAISEETARMIREQTSDNNTVCPSDSDLYNGDVTLIVKDGDVYYLPDETKNKC